jgi:tetratricopeptide (TPR) repeat protein
MLKIIKLLCLYLLILSISNNTYSQIINSYQYENVVNTGSKTTYKNGVSKTYYIENGVSVTTSANLSNQYGKYYQIHIEIENLTGSELTFNPNSIIALMTIYKTDRKTKVVSIGSQTKGVILSAEEYIKKVKRRQNFQSALYGLAAQSNANSAGYSSSVTSTAVYGHSNTYGSVSNYYTGETVNVRGSSSGSAVGTSVTQSFNGQAAYNARKDAQRETQQFDNELYQIRTELNQDYLRVNTIEHLHRLKGSINLIFEVVDKVELLIPVNGKYYSFIYSNNQEQNKQEIIQSNTISDVSTNPKVNELFNLSKSNFNNKKFQEAINSLSEAINIEPQNIILLSTRGSMYFYQLNLKDEGIADISKAILYDTLSKNKFNNFIIRCHMYFTQRKYDLILKDADEMIKLEPNKPDGYFSRALTNSELNNNYASINDYQKIINLSKNQLKTYDNLGVVYNNMGYSYVKLEDYEKALPLINKALELLPNFSYIWGSRGQLNYKMGEYKKSISDMTTAIELVENGNDRGGLSTDPSVPYYYRALSNIKRGKAIESCFDLSKAIELGNKDAVNIFNENCKK